MEAEKDEDNNPPVLWNIICTVGFVAVLAFGYWCLPVIINLVQPAIAWLNWFIWVVTYICGFVFVSTLAAWIYFAIYPKSTEKKKKRDLYDTFFPADPTPTAVHQPTMGYYDVTEVGDYNVGGNYNKEMVEAFEEVEMFKAVKESNCYGRVEVEEVNSRSYRRTRSSLEKKSRSVEYRRTESERVAKTASRRSQTTMNELSNEEFRATVESFIMEKKMILPWQNGVADPSQNGVHHWQNGVADPSQNSVNQWLNGAPQLQNGVADHWQNGVPQLQNGVGDHWQNGGIDQWQNGGVDQWQGLPYDDGRHHHRNRRLVGGSGSNGSGPYLAISN